jgi:hypothetical protein
MNWTQVIEAIDTGVMDGREDILIEALNRRRRAVSAIRAGELEPGDRIRLNGLRPKYLNGLVGTVQYRVANGKVSVKLDEDQDTGRYGHVITCPGSSLVKL